MMRTDRCSEPGFESVQNGDDSLAIRGSCFATSTLRRAWIGCRVSFDLRERIMSSALSLAAAPFADFRFGLERRYIRAACGGGTSRAAALAG